MNKCKISLFLFLLSIVIFTSSCNKTDNSQSQENEKRLIANYISTHNITVDPTASGMYIVPAVIGTGVSPTNTDATLINYRIKDVSDNILATNDTTLAKASGVFPSQVIGGLYKLFLKGQSSLGLVEGMMSMKEGGKAKFIIPSLLWGSNNYQPVIMEVDLFKVISNPITFENEQIGYFLDSICKNNNINPVLTLTDSTKTGVTGIYYIETLKGTGDSIPDGKTVTVDYTVNLISYKNLCRERLLQKGTGYASILFNKDASKSTNISGFDEGIRHMRKGGKGIVIIPFYRAYGSEGSVNSAKQIIIPPYTTLVYYIEIKDVK